MVAPPGYLVRMCQGHVVDDGLHGRGWCCVHRGLKQAVGDNARECHDFRQRVNDVRDPGPRLAPFGLAPSSRWVGRAQFPSWDFA